MALLRTGSPAGMGLGCAAKRTAAGREPEGGDTPPIRAPFQLTEVPPAGLLAALLQALRVQNHFFFFFV